jgi:glycosyltransferase involved in cell wall biosynthesis
MADEVVVIDDGSSDATAEIARSFADRLRGLQVISGPNVGLSRARNKGIAASRGEYVALIDADDVCHPTYIEKMARRLDERPAAGFAYCFLRHIDVQSRIYLETTSHEVDGWGAYQLMARNFVGSGSNAVFRRTALEAVGGYEPDVRRGEDFFNQLAICWRMPVTCVPEYLVGYRDTPHSLSKDFSRPGGVAISRLIRRDMPDIKWTARRWRLSARNVRRFSARRKHEKAALSDWLSLAGALALDPLRWFGTAADRGLALVRGEKREPGPLVGRSFYEVSPTDPGKPWPNPTLFRRLAHARRLDEQHGRARGSRAPLLDSGGPLRHTPPT